MGGTLVNEYSNGDSANGNGSYVPIMGNGTDRQRVSWRVGSSNGGEATDSGGGIPVENFQNDVKVIVGNNGNSFVDDGIGHTRATATPLPVAGGAVDVNHPLHRGVIMPLSASNPNPIGAANYTQDWFSFQSDGTHPITLTGNNGNYLLVAGTADNGLTVRTTLAIFDALGAPIATATEDPSTLLETYSGLLGAGTYFAEINSYGGHNEATASYNAAQYFDAGGFFLTGSGVSVPEPTCLGLFAVVAVGFLARRRT